MIELSYEMGKAAFGKYNSAPGSNPEFVSILPSCEFGDEKVCRLRVKMYKSYSKGWTFSNLNLDM